MIAGPILTEDLVAALCYQLEMGADEAIEDQPLDRLKSRVQPQAEATEKPYKKHIAPQKAPPSTINTEALAREATSLEMLTSAMREFNAGALKRGARSFVFSDGRADAKVMIIGEAPGQEEDRQGRPFVGKAGQLLDRMFAAIGLSREAKEPEKGLYITNVLPWRPAGNRTPDAEEIALFRPFLLRHIALARPDFVIAMGNPAMMALTGQTGILKLRGKWQHQPELPPMMPMLHPAYLLRNPIAKRMAWQDLQLLEKEMAEGSQGEGRE